VRRVQTEGELSAVRRSIVRGVPFGGPRWTKRTIVELGLESTIRPAAVPRRLPAALILSSDPITALALPKVVAKSWSAKNIFRPVRVTRSPLAVHRRYIVITLAQQRRLVEASQTPPRTTFRSASSPRSRGVMGEAKNALAHRLCALVKTAELERPKAFHFAPLVRINLSADRPISSPLTTRSLTIRPGPV